MACHEVNGRWDIFYFFYTIMVCTQWDEHPTIWVQTSSIFHCLRLPVGYFSWINLLPNCIGNSWLPSLPRWLPVCTLCLSLLLASLLYMAELIMITKINSLAQPSRKKIGWFLSGGRSTKTQNFSSKNTTLVLLSANTWTNLASLILTPLPRRVLSPKLALVLNPSLLFVLTSTLFLFRSS